MQRIMRVLFRLGLILAALMAPATGSARAAPAAIERIVTLAPHITELIFAAGAGERIVATVTSSDYPAAAKAIPRIGNGLNIDVEKILALKPDLVIAWQPGGAARTLAPTLTALHIPLIYADPKTVADIPAEIVKFGQLLGTRQIADAAAYALTKRIDALEKKYAGRKPVSVFIEIGAAPLYTIGRDPLINDVLRMCAGVNIYARSMLAAPQVSLESVLVAQPDAVVTSANGKAGLAQRVRAWTALHLHAALKQHIVAVDPDELFRPGPRLVDAAEKLCRSLDQAR